MEIIEKSKPENYFSFEGSTIYKGHLINLYMDDYGQCWVIQFMEDGELKEEGCGTYCDWRDYVEWRFRKE